MNSLPDQILNICVKGNEWVLHPEKALFWEKEKILVLSDPHLGKSGHFRKAGIAAPSSIDSKNLSRITGLIETFNPETLLILGDLFHSSANREWFQFEEWRKHYSELEIILVAGNHDILHSSFYDSAKLKTYKELNIGPFLFVHDSDQLNQQNDLSVVVSGHLHPAVKFKLPGRQRLKAPCFLFTDHQILIPAFGEFTGTHLITPQNEDKVFAVVDDYIIDASPLIE